MARELPKLSHSPDKNPRKERLPKLRDADTVISLNPLDKRDKINRALTVLQQRHQSVLHLLRHSESAS